MKRSAYGTPFLLGETGDAIQIQKATDHSEEVIQDFIFDHPDVLPIGDIDESFNPSIPICKELNTPVGPLDILMVTPKGGLIIIETKLWRNPEARRVVVAQILDYAKELASWNYEDLQREVNRRLGRKGNFIYEIVEKGYPEDCLSEADFVDSVSRNLKSGKFLLLIAGDGIREGAIGISEFLSSTGNLNFTLAMVELSLFHAKGIGTLVIPKTIVRTVEIERYSVEVPDGFVLKRDSIEVNPNSQSNAGKWEKEKSYYHSFWKELISELEFDDPGQPLPTPGNAQNLFVYPSNTRKAWISAYFMKSKNRVGVYFRTQNDPEGDAIYKAIVEEKDSIMEELGSNVTFDDKYIFTYKSIPDVMDPKNREEMKTFFKTWLNNMVNVFRPRVKDMGY